MLGSVISMMWQSIKKFHQRKEQILRSFGQNEENICLSLHEMLPW